MQIELGKTYRTRSGEKLGPAKQPWTIPGGRFEFDGTFDHLHEKDGTYCGPDRGLDIVAEWSEGPVRTETVTKRRIVPGVYGRIMVTARDFTRNTVGVRINANDPDFRWHDFTATELDELAMVASQLAEALRDA